MVEEPERYIHGALVRDEAQEVPLHALRLEQLDELHRLGPDTQRDLSSLAARNNRLLK